MLKQLVALFATASAFVPLALAQRIEFTNTTFDKPITVGQMWHVQWTIGNGNSISLSIANESWNFPLFVQRAVLPTMYDITVQAPPGMVAGNYRLSLQQLDNTVANSPSFAVVFPASGASTSSGMTSTTAVNPVSPAATVASTTTVTYVYWDHQCGCTRTGTAASPVGTGMPATTYTWYEHKCGCTKSAIVPLSSIAAGTATNYTAPMNPPIAPAPAPAATTQVAPAGTSAARNPEFTGDGSRVTTPVFGLVVLMIAVSFA